MSQRAFPGFPEGFNMIFSRQIFDASLKLENHGSERSKQFCEIYQGLSVCLLAPRAYFDLFIGIGPYYDEMQTFWNESYYINVGVSGSGKVEFITSDTSGLDTSIIDDIPADPFNLLMCILSFSQDKNAIEGIPGINDEIREQMMILNQIIWAIYMGSFKDDYFAKNLKVFTDAGLQAQKELNALRTDLN
jgi:hypothetical protein